MIIPSIDIMDGRAVQLIGGKEKALDGGCPFEVAERFSIAGPMAVIDLDAAMGRGENREVIEGLIAKYRCRVGGGIRSVEAALRWLDAGAERVILGTAATPEVLEQLPRERVIAALDAVHGEVVVEGWQKATGVQVEEQLQRLLPFCGGFLLTFVELEGRLGGTDLQRAKALAAICGDQAQVTIAGGVTRADEVSALDTLGCDAQVGMALYNGQLPLGDGISAPMRSDRPDGLWPTVVCDEMGQVLGLVYSNAESVRRAVETQKGVYWSRRRGLWEKGKTSGDTQQLLRIDLDCDRDALRFWVRQEGGGFCHEGTTSCFGASGGFAALQRTLRQRVAGAEPGSYTRKLVEDPTLLAAKLAEEAQELAEANTGDEVAWEAADVIYFAAVAMARAGVGFEQVERELDRRALTVRRRSEQKK
ncbi:MAG: phosphoribosyl-ATP diphosphatase [Deltaproteobacteria bacterium]|nr:phosphoribosyl-ATP diphosphatase [Deltaproteobacteria bacterium]